MLIKFKGIKEETAFRGLPSAGLFSVFASFCPPSKDQRNVDGFIVNNKSRQYQFLELLDAISDESLEEDKSSPFRVDNITNLIYLFEDTLKKESEERACNDSSLGRSEWIDCIVNHNGSMERVNATFLKLQRQLNLRNDLISSIVTVSESLMIFEDNEDRGGALANFIRILSYLICGEERSDNIDRTDGVEISNDQKHRLEILEAMLQGNAKILYAPSVTIVDDVISEVNKSLDAVNELQHFAAKVAQLLTGHASDSENMTLVSALLFSRL
ncbi:hypothetical protein OSTOST_24158 [Ostertagia ostertagi]